MRVNGRETTVGDGAILGRSRGVDVSIIADVVSRKHAQLRHGSSGWVINDLGSSNGLYGPDGHQVDSLALSGGTTRFSLGPPSSGCIVEVDVAEQLAEAVTKLAARPKTDAGEGQGQGQGQHYRPAIQGLSGAAAPAPKSSGVSLRAEGLSVVVDDGLTILEAASLTIRGGTMTAVIGPSGCGKSTLANLLSGRSEPTTGSVAVNGEPMSVAMRKRIGVVPQYDAVHERLTVRQALSAAARLRLSSETPSETIKRSVVATATTLGLESRLDTRVAKLSGGQKKRVSVGYELVSDPVMMVLDEPTSGLDPGLEQELIAELRALADRGTTTVLVTHSTEAAEQADLVVVMAPGGHVAFVGSPPEVLEHFGASAWSEVFARLTADTGPRWAAYFSGTEAYRRHVATPPPPPSPAEVLTLDHHRSWLGDFAVMTGRYMRSIVADPRSLLLLAAQAPILGLLFAFVLSRNVFGPSLRPTTSAREFVLASILAMVWIGSSNSIREIVKERRTFLRERAVGVSASSLVASRWAVLSLITVLQSIVLFVTATFRQETPLSEGVVLSNGPIEMMSAFALVGLASVGIGLVMSGLVQDSAKAMALLPIVLIPIVMFSGLLIPTAGNLGLEQISYANPVQWGSSAAASTANVLEKEGCNPTGLEAQLQQAFLGRTISCSNPRWQPTASAQAVNFIVGVLWLLALVAVSFWVTVRSTRVIRI